MLLKLLTTGRSHVVSMRFSFELGMSKVVAFSLFLAVLEFEDPINLPGVSRLLLPGHSLVFVSIELTNFSRL